MSLVDKLTDMFKDKLEQGLMPHYYLSIDHDDGSQAALFFNDEARLFAELDRISQAMAKSGKMWNYHVGMFPVVIKFTFGF